MRRAAGPLTGLLVAALVVSSALGLGGAALARRASSDTGLGTHLQALAKLGAGVEGGESEGPTVVALSGDGDTALVGAPGDDGGAGSVSVFTRSGSNWIQQGPPLAGAGESGQGGFGGSVALSADGDIALIGAGADGSPREPQCCATGAVWVFRRSGQTWSQLGAKLTVPRAGSTGEFGASVALSASGETALIGAPGSGRAGTGWIFAHARSGWRPEAKLVGRGASRGAFFGSSVALDASGDRALIGGEGGSGGGAAWVFTRRHSSWVGEGPPLTGKEDNRFGAAVALSGAGDVALVGDGGTDAEKGAAWIFTRSRSGWRRSAKLTARGERGLGNFGESVALSADGRIALIGCPMEEASGPKREGFGAQRVGSVWLFSGPGPRWTRRATLPAPGASIEDGMFGLTLAVSQTAATALVGVEVDLGGPGTAWLLSSLQPLF